MDGDNMVVFPVLDDDVADEIRFGLPSYKILRYVTTLVVRQPSSGNLIILKWRLPASETKALQESNFEELKDRRTWDADWSDLFRKHIIINPIVLNHRAQKLLSEW